MKSESNTVTARELNRLYQWRRDRPSAAEMERADCVSSERIPPDVVAMNSQVRFADESSGSSHEVTIVHPDDADAARGRISVPTPVGIALRGLSVETFIDWLCPHGTTRRLRVLKVRHQAEAKRQLRMEFGFHPGVFWYQGATYG